MRRTGILFIAVFLLLASSTQSQEYRDIDLNGKIISHWFPAREILTQTTSEVVEFLDANGNPLKRITGIFAFDNQLYVYDSATGHAHLYSADRRYLTQLTDPNHPINPGSGDGYGSVISADISGRVLLATGSGMHLIDGIQYTLPDSIYYTRGAVLYNNTIVRLLLPYSIAGDVSCQIETCSLLGGMIRKPWDDINIDAWHQYIATEGNKLVIVSGEGTAKIIKQDGKVKQIIFEGMDNPVSYSGRELGQAHNEGKSIFRPRIHSAQLYYQKLYLFLWSNFGHNFICEYDLDGTMLRAWQADRPHELNKWINATAVVFVDDTPLIYAYRKSWGEVPSPGEIVVYTPVLKRENAEAVQ